MASSSPSRLPYPLRELPNGYGFQTDAGIEYLVYFTEAEGYFEGYAFAPYAQMFGFGPIGHLDKVPLDARTAPTVLQVAELFLQDPRSVLVYFCDTHDRRQAARYRRFLAWLQAYEHRNDYIQRPLVAAPDVYAMIVYRPDNPFAADIEDSLPSLQEKISPTE